MKYCFNYLLLNLLDFALTALRNQNPHNINVTFIFAYCRLRSYGYSFGRLYIFKRSSHISFRPWVGILEILDKFTNLQKKPSILLYFAEVFKCPYMAPWVYLQYTLCLKLPLT
jgi:hypothetical protein